MFSSGSCFCGQDNVGLVRQLGILIDIADLNLAAIGGHRLIEGGSEAAHVLMLALHELDILSRRVAASAHSGAEADDIAEDNMGVSFNTPRPAQRGGA